MTRWRKTLKILSMFLFLTLTLSPDPAGCTFSIKPHSVNSPLIHTHQPSSGSVIWPQDYNDCFPFAHPPPPFHPCPPQIYPPLSDQGHPWQKQIISYCYPSQIPHWLSTHWEWNPNPHHIPQGSGADPRPPFQPYHLPPPPQSAPENHHSWLPHTLREYSSRDLRTHSPLYLGIIPPDGHSAPFLISSHSFQFSIQRCPLERHFPLHAIWNSCLLYSVNTVLDRLYPCVYLLSIYPHYSERFTRQGGSPPLSLLLFLLFLFFPIFLLPSVYPLPRIVPRPCY